MAKSRTQIQVLIQVIWSLHVCHFDAINGDSFLPGFQEAMLLLLIP